MAKRSPNKKLLIVQSPPKNLLPDAKRTFKSSLGGTFTGSRNTLVDILNPHVANWLQRKTKTLKNKLAAKKALKCYNPKCESDPKEIKSVDTAHPIDSARPLVIRQAIGIVCPAVEGGSENLIRDCDIAEVLATTKKLHESLSITFLCNVCNKNHSKLARYKIPKMTLKEWASNY